MSHVDNFTPGGAAENCRLREANAKVAKLLGESIEKLRATLNDKSIVEEAPLEVWAVIDSALEAMRAALQVLASADHTEGLADTPLSSNPTRQQGQFLAFIREYMMRNEAGVAPTHAILQQFFNLTAPSVNSMLIRLEKRGFIRRVPGKARAISLTIRSDRIPQLDRPFRVR